MTTTSLCPACMYQYCSNLFMNGGVKFYCTYQHMSLICCQSPQYMKGLLFRLLYATRAFYQFVAASIMFMITEWNSTTIMTCRLGYYLLNILIGVMTLILYTVAAKRYKYQRERHLGERRHLPCVQKYRLLLKY